MINSSTSPQSSVCLVSAGGAQLGGLEPFPKKRQLSEQICKSDVRPRTGSLEMAELSFPQRDRLFCAVFYNLLNEGKSSCNYHTISDPYSPKATGQQRLRVFKTMFICTNTNNYTVVTLG